MVQFKTKIGQNWRLFQHCSSRSDSGSGLRSILDCVAPKLDGLLFRFFDDMVGGMILFLSLRIPLVRDGAGLLPGLLFRFLFLLFCFLSLRLFFLLLPSSLLPVQAFLLDLVRSLFDPFLNIRVPLVTVLASVDVIESVGHASIPFVISHDQCLLLVLFCKNPLVGIRHPCNYTLIHSLPHWI